MTLENLGANLKRWSIAIVWLLGTCLILWSGTQPDGYMLHVRGIPLPHPYPWKGVLTFLFIHSVESIVLFAIIRPATYVGSWRRTLVAFLLFLGLFGLLGLGSMHAPPYLGIYLAWLMFVAIGLLILTLRRAS